MNGKFDLLMKGAAFTCKLKRRSFAKFIGRHLSQGLFLIKLQVSACHFIKRDALAQMFSCEFCEIFKSNVFTEDLRETASLLKVFEKQLAESLI